MRHLHWCCLRPHKAASGADDLKHTTALYSCHGIFIDQSIFRSNFPGMKLPWECHDQSLETNLTSLRMAVVRSYSSASVNFAKEENLRSSINIFFGTLYGTFFLANRRFPSADKGGGGGKKWWMKGGIRNMDTYRNPSDGASISINFLSQPFPE